MALFRSNMVLYGSNTGSMWVLNNVYISGSVVNIYVYITSIAHVCIYIYVTFTLTALRSSTTSVTSSPVRSSTIPIAISRLTNITPIDGRVHSSVAHGDGRVHSPGVLDSKSVRISTIGDEIIQTTNSSNAAPSSTVIYRQHGQGHGHAQQQGHGHAQGHGHGAQGHGHGHGGIPVKQSSKMVALRSKNASFTNNSFDECFPFR